MTDREEQRREAVPPAAAHEEPFPEADEGAPPGVRTMAVVRWGLVVAMAIVAAASLLGGLQCGRSRDVAGTPGSSQAAAQYQCPMHPSIVQDRPGECPICGMTLVERSDGDEVAAGAPTDAPRSGAASTPAGAASHVHAAPGTPGDAAAPRADVPGLVAVDLKPERIQLAGLKTAEVVRAELRPRLRTVGFVAAPEDGVARIHTRYAGWIEDLAVSRTGDRVARGQVLASVYSPELLGAQQELVNALRWSKEPSPVPAGPHEGAAARPSFVADARRRLELLGIARPEIDEIERTGRPARAVKIRSPIDGWVTRKNAVAGSYVEPGTELFEITDLATVWVLADVYEHELARVRSGEAARFAAVALPGRELRGRVEFVYPTVDPRTRTARVRLDFPNPDLQLKPGMYGDVEIDLAPAQGLVVPAEAIVDTGDLQYVFLARDGGRFELRLVRLGARSDGRVDVLEGVRAGDVVVTTGNFLIDSESRLRAAIAGLGGAGDAAPKPAAAAGGPPMVRDEDGLLVGYVYVDIDQGTRDIGGYVNEAKEVVGRATRDGELRLPAGYFLKWTGQYELLEQLVARMKIVVPVTLMIVVVLLYAHFRNFVEVLIVLLSVPFALVSSIWILWLLDYRLSTAVWVGIIALVGLAAQTGIVLIVYIDNAYERRRQEGRVHDLGDIIRAHMEGTVQRVRPKLMTVSTMLFGLLPLLWAEGSGADVMKRIAAPMVGGLVTSAFLTLEIIPVISTYSRQEQLLWERLAALAPLRLARLRREAGTMSAGWAVAAASLVATIYVVVPAVVLLGGLVAALALVLVGGGLYVLDRRPAYRVVWPQAA